MNFMNRIKVALTGEDGASNLEIIVWMSVVLIIATLLFAFKDQIAGFLSRAGNTVKGLKVK